MNQGQCKGHRDHDGTTRHYQCHNISARPQLTGRNQWVKNPEARGLKLQCSSQRILTCEVICDQKTSLLQRIKVKMQLRNSNVVTLRKSIMQCNPKVRYLCEPNDPVCDFWCHNMIVTSFPVKKLGSESVCFRMVSLMNPNLFFISYTKVIACANRGNWSHQAML